ncbi:MAG: hypothetical protein M9949_04655 [Candidatus Kapabacteria bacterium]|nr:hypothetical protein [Candidatus Kapabacteria bacterium]
MKLIIAILLSVTLSGCSIFQTSADYLIDNIEITWKPNKAQDTAPVDSIVVKFAPVYWVEPPCEGDSIPEIEYEFTKDGYEIWTLNNEYARRTEVFRKDTVIYIYRK